jgi:hypothetical protein
MSPALMRYSESNAAICTSINSVVGAQYEKGMCNRNGARLRGVQVEVGQYPLQVRKLSGEGPSGERECAKLLNRNL